ncbi:hypothetical protein ACW2Q0_24730 [Nocardia sp. R16R-3T]
MFDETSLRKPRPRQLSGARRAVGWCNQARTFLLERAAAAQEESEKGRGPGKVVLDVS